LINHRLFFWYWAVINFLRLKTLRPLWLLCKSHIKWMIEIHFQYFTSLLLTDLFYIPLYQEMNLEGPHNKRNKEQRTENKNFNLSETVYLYMISDRNLIRNSDWNSYFLFSILYSFYYAELLTPDMSYSLRPYNAVYNRSWRILNRRKLTNHSRI